MSVKSKCCEKCYVQINDFYGYECGNKACPCHDPIPMTEENLNGHYPESCPNCTSYQSTTENSSGGGAGGGGITFPKKVGDTWQLPTTEEDSWGSFEKYVRSRVSDQYKQEVINRTRELLTTAKEEAAEFCRIMQEEAKRSGAMEAADKLYLAWKGNTLSEEMLE